MPDLLTARPISGLAVELLARSLVLAGTISRVPEAELAGPSGGTVTVRVPTPREAREQTTPAAVIDFDAIAETPVVVSVKHFYNGALLADEHLTLLLQDYGTQVLLPQVEAVARAAEDEVADVMNDLDPDPVIVWAIDPDPEADDETVLAIREALTVAEVPASNRWVAVAPDIASRILRVPKFVEADKRGSTTALASAEIGTVYGLRFIESAAITAGNAVAYHRSGFVLATAKPQDPPNADSASATAGGVTLRHVIAYVPDRLASAATTSVFAGCSLVTEDEPGTVVKRAIRVATTPGS